MADPIVSERKTEPLAAPLEEVSETPPGPFCRGADRRDRVGGGRVLS